MAKTRGAHSFRPRVRRSGGVVRGCGAPAHPRLEGMSPHESSPLLSLEDIKFKRERRVSETGKGKYKMKNEGKKGFIYRRGGR